MLKMGLSKEVVSVEGIINGYSVLELRRKLTKNTNLL